MDLYAQIVVKIIQSQEAIIGPLAVEQAMLIPHLTANWAEHSVALTGSEPEIVNALVRQYERMFGKVSVEVCKEAAAPIIRQMRPDQIPQKLL